HRGSHGGGGGGTGSSSGGGDPGTPESKNVWVLRGSTPEQVAIHAGLSDGTVTEVVDGLAEGDQVVVDVDTGDSSSAPATSGRPPGGGSLRMF
ncbi:MAG: efflux RND transporter periplasmic adaptor subunit, partial [Polyangiaceae bacterium]